MSTYKNKSFVRFARRAGITDAALCDAVLRDAVLRAGRGQVDADLGGGVIKQRIARAGGGRSGGFRVIVLFRREDRAFFVHGFAKNEGEPSARRTPDAPATGRGVVRAGVDGT